MGFETGMTECTLVSTTLAQIRGILQSQQLCHASLNNSGMSLTIFVMSLIIFDTVQLSLTTPPTPDIMSSDKGPSFVRMVSI